MNKSIRQSLAAAALAGAMALIAFQSAGKLTFWQKLGLSKEGDLPIYATRPIKFSHAVHAGKEAIDCLDCHTKADKEDLAGMPSIKACLNCHDSDEDQDQKLKPFLVNNEPEWTKVTAISPDVKFSHKGHLDKKVSCEECHQGIKQSDGVSQQLHVTMDACIACHTAKTVATDCKVCHKEISKDRPPPSHQQNWKRFHGQVVEGKWDDKSYQNRCTMCHTQAACTKCHQEEQPITHTAQWREKGHGVNAEMDRSSCMVCHRTDYCDRCHREIEPRSHRAGWGPPSDRHCLTCHTTLSDQGCNACHQVTTHPEAPRLPTKLPHPTASESACRTCHSNTPPHPDNGDPCRSCHR